ncbi:PRC and DUF2382 domain-containing protein [Nakamurella flavida]|uniref:PRC and DUF2382 domain-containing protein n=1 Tax=Nakamurella flavida TaxID=363630 RepID=A0A939C421_9ACTN|nr:PRC and DUF2382 domain-containing protein [Nakamurella flavida]MBM9477631.1 PRC and DUF2382 domain-containing protein [Nakamurella flavida]MDP9779181.1 uncharacterized protein (TIGR02271 family) [Nakamurella flavida]
MIKQNQAQQLLDGGEVVGSDGEKIGKIGQVYLDNESGDVTWVTVKTGFFGSSESFVPTDNATVDGDTVTVPYDKSKIKDAPHSSDAGDALNPEQENDLYSYYGVGNAGYTTGTTDTETVTTQAPVVDTAVAGDTTDATPRAEDYLTRSEEQLRVGTTTREAGKARLRKFVVTEEQTVTVPVSHEEVRIVREPIQPGDSLDGATIGDDAIEVTLHEDQVVVDKDVVGVEKVRLDTQTVTEQQQVTEQVRKEQIEMGDVTNTAADVDPRDTDTSRTQR